MMKRIWIAFLILCAGVQLEAMESITGSDSTYLDMCEKAAADPYYFQHFRGTPEYSHAVEIFNGHPFAEKILNGDIEVISLIGEFRRLDMIGSPAITRYAGIGPFSATTLRYIVVGEHIRQLFHLPSDAKIVEIGGGFGGQCFILSVLQGFSRYFIYDLPPVNQLIKKSLAELSVSNAVCLAADSSLPEDRVDLLISNYAFSECSRETQLDYFERVIKKADRGYIIYNQISKPYFGIDSLTPWEFFELLDEAGMNPSVCEEQISTHSDNILFTWDRTAL
ncbi:MAG: putative sugar O-methyltransferase [Parachlamydiales bacterium]|nr:putative sugar O-methyltransferase [Candidatus Acheromyda pituitae]